MHAEPFAPHAPPSVPGWHRWLPSQQPSQQVPPGVQPRRSVRHAPFASQQPSGQVAGVQWLSRQVPVCALHDWFGPQAVQAVPPSPQAPWALPGWQRPSPSQQPLGQVRGEHVFGPWHLPFAPQVWPTGQVPQVPPLPQPSSPHARPAQFGAQHSPAGLHWLAGG